MNGIATIPQKELEWRNSIHGMGSRDTIKLPLLTICGPSGSGKTTVVAALAAAYPTFVETTGGNPHLKDLLEGNEKFNAAASQEWFLRRVGEHVARACTCSPLVLDQDPAAIVLAYSRMFLEDGKIIDAQYVRLLQELLQMEETLRAWRCPRIVLCLDAPAEVLRQRVRQRSDESHTPPVAWFDRVRAHFVELFSCFPNAIKVSTVDLSSEQVIARVRALIESHGGRYSRLSEL